MVVLVTGAAGFIGFHISRALLARGDRVIGVDNLNDYYSVALKQARLQQLLQVTGFTFVKMDVSDREQVLSFAELHPDISGIIHLAAQAGVRHSLIDPYLYVQSNVMGQVIMLELARRLPQLAHIVYASSSSVYGANTKLPFSVEDAVNRPSSLYAATKRADELIGHTYAHLYGIPGTGLRFFTVYGPWGRPDMAAYIFTRAIIAGDPIQMFNRGDMRRDFTFIDDVVSGVLSALDKPPAGKPPHVVYNLGNNRSERLLDFVAQLEQAIGKKAKVELLPMQLGDVRETSADIRASRRDLGFEPRTPIQKGLPQFVKWYRNYHGI